MKRALAILALAMLAGCKCNDCAIGATRFDNGVERVEWSREVRRGTSKSSFDVSVDMPKDAEYREIVLELIGKAWRHGVGPSTRRVMLENLEDAYEDFRTIVAEVYPEDFDLSEYGASGDIYGRVEALDEDCMRYRLRAAYQPVGNPAYGCELEVEARRYGDDGRVKRSLLIKEVAPPIGTLGDRSRDARIIIRPRNLLALGETNLPRQRLAWIAMLCFRNLEYRSFGV